MLVSNSASSSVKNNRAKLKSKRERFKFRKMLTKSAQPSKSMIGFIKAKDEYRNKVKRDELMHWKRLIGLVLVSFIVLFLLYKLN